MKKLFFMTFLMLSISCFAQDTKRGTIKVKKAEVAETKTPNLAGYVKVGQMPMFPGGQSEMNAFIKKNLKYPIAERKAGIQGTVRVRFTVNLDGGITNVNILEGIPGAPGLEQEALRIVSIMPKWTPGLKNNKQTIMQYNLPIKFQL